MQQQNHYKRAFSLVEIAIVLIIVGLLVAVGVNMSSGLVDNQKRISTEQKTKLVEDALRAYYDINGRLPCPADPMQAKGSATLGAEDCTLADVSGVRIGAVPVRALGIPDTMIADDYGNRFTYAVEIDMTNANTVANAAGDIEVRDADAEMVGNAVYFITSHGEDGKGAVNNETATRDPNCSGTANDIENCDNANATFVQTRYMKSDIETNNFDDAATWGPKETLVQATANNVTGDANCNAGNEGVTRFNATNGMTEICQGGNWTSTANPCDGDNQGALFFNPTTNRMESCDPAGNSSFNNCGAGGASWTVSGKTCNGSSTAGVHGATILLNDTVQNTLGSAQYRCVNGTWTERPGATCLESCVLDGVTLNHGESHMFFTDPTVPFGTLCSSIGQTRTCNNGTLSGSAANDTASCTVDPAVGCTAGGRTWVAGGRTCSASVTAATHTQTRTATDSSGAITGSASYECNNGSWVEQPGATCIVSGSICGSTAFTCNSGTPSPASGPGTCGTTSNWTCTFPNPVNNESCSITHDPCPVNGVCNNSVALGCTAGNAISDNGLTACGTNRQWVCEGTNGGSNSGTCTFANPTCSGCLATTLNWGGSCTAGIGAGANNDNVTINDTTGPDTGSAPYRCLSGTWTLQAGSSCTAGPTTAQINTWCPPFSSSDAFGYAQRGGYCNGNVCYCLDESAHSEYGTWEEYHEDYERAIWNGTSFSVTGSCNNQWYSNSWGDDCSHTTWDAGNICALDGFGKLTSNCDDY